MAIINPDPIGENLDTAAQLINWVNDLGGGNAQLLGLDEHFFALETKFLRNVVDTNGHNYFSLPPAEMNDSPSWLKSRKQMLLRSAP